MWVLAKTQCFRDLTFREGYESRTVYQTISCCLVYRKTSFTSKKEKHNVCTAKMLNPNCELNKLFLSWFYKSQIFQRETPRPCVCPNARAGTSPILFKIGKDEKRQKESSQAEGKKESKVCVEWDHTVQDNEGVKMAHRRWDLCKSLNKGLRKKRKKTTW